ncbi:MAG: hypothetical protein ABIQ93_13705 [Saprospiraceae bacterium]
MTQQIIDSINGHLKFTNDFTISSQTTPEEIVQYFGLKNLDIRDVNTGWNHYSVRNIKINDIYFIITFYFDNDILKMIDFIVSDKFIVASWDDWTEKKESQNRDYYDDWLTKEIGKNRQFSWGTIGSFYDKKGGSSSIVLKYKWPPVDRL